MTVGSDVTHADLALLAERSVELIDRHQSPSGAYPASPTFSAYQGYAWLRDGAFIAEGMSRMADPAGPSAFHAWCARVVGARGTQVSDLIARTGRGLDVSPADMLPTRFTLDGSNGTDEWWDHQLDGYGTWLWSLNLHVRRHNAEIPGLTAAVRTVTEYLTAFWQVPCYDWWEEHVDQRHVSTLGAIHAGLRAAIALGVLTRPLTEAAEEAIEAIAILVANEGVARLGEVISSSDIRPGETNASTDKRPRGVNPGTATQPGGVDTSSAVGRANSHGAGGGGRSPEENRGWVG
ncbi:glycoside hydrolase family 15 protein, partial [Acrocarpospora corrugata]